MPQSHHTSSHILTYPHTDAPTHTHPTHTHTHHTHTHTHAHTHTRTTQASAHGAHVQLLLPREGHVQGRHRLAVKEAPGLTALEEGLGLGHHHTMPRPGHHPHQGAGFQGGQVGWR
jgi:hypothetical protein